MLEVPELGYKPTIGEIVRRAAAEWPDKDFVVMPHARLTFATAERESRAFAKRLLAAGLGKGSRVAIYDTYSIEWVIAWLGATRIGCLVMPFSSIYRPAELATVLRVGDVHTLLAPASILGRPVGPQLEQALPGLNASPPALRLRAAPFLREIWMWGDQVPSWAVSVRFDDRTDTGIDDALFDAVEEGSFLPTWPR